MVQLPTVPLPPAVFLGRSAELDKLASAFQRVAVAVIIGVAGIGKTSLALSFVASAGSGPVVFLRARPAGLAGLVDDARRALSGSAVAEVATDEQRIEDLAARLNRERATILIDDVRASGSAAALELVSSLAGLLREGRAIITCRTRLGRRAEDPDWLELELRGLSEGASRQLWGALDELYGPSGDFESVPDAVRKSPFLLRRAHAGALSDDDPIELSVRALDAAERHAAIVLAFARQRLSVAALEQALGPSTRRVLSLLVRQLVVELDAGRTAAVSGPFLETVISLATAGERRAAHSVLAQIAAASARDPVVAFRDEIFHLVEAGDTNAACGRAHALSAEMVRLGATGEVLRAIESVPLAARSVEARIAHARALARLVEPRRAYEELALLDAEPVAQSGPPEPWRAEVRFSLATTTYMVGRIDAGLALLDELLTLPTLAPGLAFQIELQRAWALTTSGRGREARATLQALEDRYPAEEQRALLAFYRAVSAWSDEDEAAVREALPRALTLIPDQAPPYATGGLIPLSLAVIMARLARFEESDRFLSLAEVGWARAEDPSSQLLLRRMRGLSALERGDRLEALALLRPVADAYERAGSLVAQLGVRAVLGRLLLVLGRRAEGHAMLDATEALASRCGGAQAALAVARARNADPLRVTRAEEPIPPAPARRGEHVRWHTLRALSAAETGDAERVRGLLNGLPTGGAGYGLDRAIVAIAEAALRRVEGDLGEAAALQGRALREARDDGADEDVVRQLAQRIAGPMLVTGGSRQPSRAPLGPARLDVVLDGRTHRLTTASADLDLGKRPTLRKLLYALARRPGTIFTKQQLAKAIWPARYNPLTHDNALWVNVRRLRVLLSETQLEITSDDHGYRLEAPPDFVFVDPA